MLPSPPPRLLSHGSRDRPAQAARELLVNRGQYQDAYNSVLQSVLALARKAPSRRALEELLERQLDAVAPAESSAERRAAAPESSALRMSASLAIEAATSYLDHARTAASDDALFHLRLAEDVLVAALAQDDVAGGQPPPLNPPSRSPFLAR